MALGPLFRAAGALGTDTPAGSACSITYTRKLLYWLWKDATAAAFEEESPQVSPQHCHGLQHQLLLRRPRAMFSMEGMYRTSHMHDVHVALHIE